VSFGIVGIVNGGHWLAGSHPHGCWNQGWNGRFDLSLPWIKSKKSASTAGTISFPGHWSRSMPSAPCASTINKLAKQPSPWAAWVLSRRCRRRGDDLPRHYV